MSCRTANSKYFQISIVFLLTGSLSRSASSTDRGDLVSGGGGTSRTTSVGNLTSSFAQTELNLNAVMEETAKDMIDSGMQASSGMYKERNISVTEEEYEPQSLLLAMGTSSGDDSATAMAVSGTTTTATADHKERYSSVSEGDDVMVDAIGGGESAEEVTMIGNIMNILSFNSIV